MRESVYTRIAHCNRGTFQPFHGRDPPAGRRSRTLRTWVLAWNIHPLGLVTVMRRFQAISYEFRRRPKGRHRPGACHRGEPLRGLSWAHPPNFPTCRQAHRAFRPSPHITSLTAGGAGITGASDRCAVGRRSPCGPQRRTKLTGRGIAPPRTGLRPVRHRRVTDTRHPELGPLARAGWTTFGDGSPD